MNNPVLLKTNYNLLKRFYFENVFSEVECLKILESKETSKQGSYTEYGEQDQKSSTIKSKFLNKSPENDWVWERLTEYAWRVNQDYYNFRLSYLDDLQIMEYCANSVFHWHIDINGAEHFTSRKLSIVVFLSERSAYEGGQLLFDINGREENLTGMNRGSLIIFPSFQIHKVTALTGGLRNTLVAWAHGIPFS